MVNEKLMSCRTYNNIGIINRIILTIIAYFLIWKYWPNLKNTISNPKNNYFYLLFPIILTVLDLLDCFWSLGFYINRKCHHTFYYQITDKINDSLSYLVSWKVFGLDNLYLYFALFRCIGVVLFGLTKNATWLIIFPDLNKEYLLYQFFCGTNLIYLWLVVIGKVLYEYVHHTFTNQIQY
jgi:hypothetical protein